VSSSDPVPSRKYRLKRREPTDAGIRRIATGRAEHALELLRDRKAEPSEAVHEARKDTKKLRSVLRLVRDELGDSTYRRENDRFRDAAGRLSDARDAQVRGETLTALRERYAGTSRNLDGADWEALERDLAAQGDAGASEEELRASMQQSAEEIERGREVIEGWDLDGDGGFDLVADGLRRAYSRGRRRFTEAHADPTTERLHEWRKRAKDLWYHLRILRPAWPELMKATAGEAHELTDRLGDDHDLALLRQAAEERVAKRAPKRFDRLADLIDRRRSELQAEAFALGERLYAEKPKAFVARVRALWEAERV